MTRIKLKNLIQRSADKPVRICLADGANYKVSHPDFAFTTPESLILASGPGHEIGAEFVVWPILHCERDRRFSTIAGCRNRRYLPRMSATELVTEKVKQLSEPQAQAVLEYIETLARKEFGTPKDDKQLESACLAANADPLLQREIQEWQAFDDPFSA